jgi:hypothetical protein
MHAWACVLACVRVGLLFVGVCSSVCVSVCVCARSCVRACVRACVSACLCVCSFGDRSHVLNCSTGFFDLLNQLSREIHLQKAHTKIQDHVG